MKPKKHQHKRNITAHLQRQIVELTTAKNIPERLGATAKLVADADSYVNMCLREIGDESPSIEKTRLEIQGKLAVAQASKPEDGTEEMDHWKEYVQTLEHQREHVVDMGGTRVGYRALVEKWDEMYVEWSNIVAAMAMMVEGGGAQVFSVNRMPKRDVVLSSDPATRGLMIQAMGVPDFEQEVITSHVEIMRGIGELDRRMFVAAGKFSAVFAEIVYVSGDGRDPKIRDSRNEIEVVRDIG